MKTYRIKKHAKWLLLLPFIFPFKVVVVPEWQVIVKNESGDIVAGAEIDQTWQHYTLESSGNVEEKKTDNNGVVIFEERVIWTNMLFYFFGGLFNILGTGIHASFGPSSWVFANANCKFGSVVYIPDHIFDKELVLSKDIDPSVCSITGW